MPNNATYKVLVADDSEEVRKMIARALGAENIECVAAADGVIATNHLRSRRFDMVILDLVMPRVNGHKLATDLLAMQDPPIVVVITGATDARLARDLLVRGVADIYFKPIQLELFAAKMRSLLERAAATRAAAPGAPQRGGAAKGDSISDVTDMLRNDFARMTASFERTIQQLEKRNNDLKSDFINSVQMFISLMDRKGHAGTSHAGRVEKAVAWYGAELGLSPDDKHELQVASILHEIGQFGMPDFIRLKKPWELTREERDVYEKYPIMGATLMSEVRGAEGIAEIIEFHAENFDGSGFPHRKSGEEIPLRARILRLADGVDTYQMFSASKCPEEELQQYVRSKMGVVFDPALAGLAARYIASLHEQPDDAPGEIVPANAIPLGGILADNVYDPDGRFLARAGAVATAGLVSRLATLLGSVEVRIRTKPGA